jgi:hypothetical protein
MFLLYEVLELLAIGFRQIVEKLPIHLDEHIGLFAPIAAIQREVGYVIGAAPGLFADVERFPRHKHFLLLGSRDPQVRENLTQYTRKSIR